MSRVIVGVDPHKKSVTIEAVDEHGLVLGRGRYGTDTAGYRLMLTQVREQWPQHHWAVEGAQGVGRPLAQRFPNYCGPGSGRRRLSRLQQQATQTARAEH